MVVLREATAGQIFFHLQVQMRFMYFLLISAAPSNLLAHGIKDSAQGGHQPQRQLTMLLVHTYSHKETHTRLQLKFLPWHQVNT